ncbi:hypothetical protein M426DRAFT_246994 [Hypoxylon sp. CI-4A]|nr:hypothetical protein M426DRAFT_246994 [Hypoxylon sp. CI-4A]
MAYTAETPHSCACCQNIILDLGSNNSEKKLSCTVQEALNADRAGCPLFHAFISSIKGSFENHRLTFIIRYEKQDLPWNPAAIVLIVNETKDDESGKVDVRGYTRLSLWTTEENAASADISTQPYELDYASPASVEFARSCIQSCQTSHEGCRRSVDDIMARQGSAAINPDAVPSRLLELVTIDSVLHVKLIGLGVPSAIEKEVISQQGFAVLSYCWGGPQPVQLTRDSVRELSNGIPISNLPKSLHDAAWFADAIGLKYLWIDALCIFQDDIEDKIHEISRMEIYYGQSTVTLCAASASRCSDGFLSPREDDPKKYSIGPIQLKAKASSGLVGSVQALAEPDYFNSWRSQEPVTLRGWTLQEALLSRRILIFSSYHLYFTCTVANASCGGMEPLLKPRVMTSFESPVAGVHTLSGLRDYPVNGVWSKIVGNYTMRNLGFVADKLPAVSALASSLLPMAHERGQKLVYLAGLMIDTPETDNYTWRDELLWRVSRTHSSCSIPTGSPSWSWSSVDGRIVTWRQSRPPDWETPDEIQLSEYNVELENEIAPFGAVKSGFVKIHARIKGLETIRGVNHRIVTERDPGNDIVDPNQTLLVISPDTPEGLRQIELGVQGELRVFLVQLIPYFENRVSPVGLIVTKVPGTDRYARVGMFEFQYPNKQSAEEMDARRGLFEGSPLEDICII